MRFNYSPKPLSIGLALEHQRLQQAGTSVRVEGLFGDMPVRMKFNQSKLDEDKEWEEHKRVITSLLLIWVASNEAQAISVIVRDGGARKFIVKPRGTDSAEDRNGMYDHISKGRELQILHQVYSVQEIGPTSDWERVRARKGLISLDGWISTVGAPTKKYQFICKRIFFLIIQDHIAYTVF